uniref:OTU domain-containing protein n=1 Tax=Cacopsylla melanoneura TaxID=428564 RepID=A0A8D9AAQ5_9HEMI
MKRSYKASEKNDVNGFSLTSDPASGRRPEAPQVVTMRSPQPSISTQHQITATNVNKAFNIQRIVGDGNCLFRSVSLYLYNTQDRHMELRAEAVPYISKITAETIKDVPGKHNLLQMQRAVVLVMS